MNPLRLLTLLILVAVLLPPLSRDRRDCRPRPGIVSRRSMFGIGEGSDNYVVGCEINKAHRLLRYVRLVMIGC